MCVCAYGEGGFFGWTSQPSKCTYTCTHVHGTLQASADRSSLTNGSKENGGTDETTHGETKQDDKDVVVAGEEPEEKQEKGEDYCQTKRASRYYCMESGQM